MQIAIRTTPESLRAMIQAWLVAHGGARQYRRGESTDFFYIQRWLYERGYTLSAAKGSFFIRDLDGQRRSMKWREVIDLVDLLRRTEGLEPVQRLP